MCGMELVRASCNFRIERPWHGIEHRQCRWVFQCLVWHHNEEIFLVMFSNVSAPIRMSSKYTIPFFPLNFLSRFYITLIIMVGAFFSPCCIHLVLNNPHK